MNKPVYDVIVIGGGAAGQMAAWSAAKQGAKVLILEKMPQLGLKMGITGKGRCNLTNGAPIGEFISRTPGNGRFLFSAYQRFDNQDLLELLSTWGLGTKEERGGRIFPVSDSAQEVRRKFRQALERAGVDIRCAEKVVDWDIREGRLANVKTANSEYAAKAVILTTGGASYPATGSSGDGYDLAVKVGHSIQTPRPALIPLVCAEDYCRRLQGLSLRNVDLSLWINGKEKWKQRGEMLFTHFGVSGPLVLLASDMAGAALAQGKSVELRISLKPALSQEQLDARVRRELEAHPRQQMKHAIESLLPQKIILPLLEYAEIDVEKIAAELSRPERLRWVEALQDFRLTVTATRSLEEAIVTAGGVKVKEINPQTMASKLVPNLYFAGEVIDIHAHTGGYNLQAAFSTGFVAGEEAGRNWR